MSNTFLTASVREAVHPLRLCTTICFMGFQINGLLFLVNRNLKNYQNFMYRGIIDRFI